MDCSICLEQITKTTGCTTLSCDHSFHFRCISDWFLKQRDDALCQACPCCRNEGTGLDRCKNIEIDDYEEDEEDESGELDNILSANWDISFAAWLIYTAHDRALENSRALFGPLNELEVEEDADKEPRNRNENADRGLAALNETV